jgi:hypothetical protein
VWLKAHIKFVRVRLVDVRAAALPINVPRALQLADALALA